VSLLDDARVAVRVTSTATDSELQMWVDAAIADMRRCGVRDELLDEESETFDPMVRSAVVCYVKANYGFDNAEAPRFTSTYKSILAALLNSKANEYIFPEEGE
jgi:hypothetical protein